jgi:CheY-like chemotaxis protein
MGILRLTWKSSIAASWSSAIERKRLLIVDDDAALLNLLSALFSPDFDVRTARDGREALAIVSRELPEAIVLDLEMPGMDGRSFYRELRARGLNTPVLLLSAYGARRARDELGAQGHVAKPFEPSALLDEVSRLIS